MAPRALRTLGAVAGVLVLTVAPYVAAQRDYLRYLPDEAGKWKPWSFTPLTAGELRSIGATPADEQLFERHIRQIADLLRGSSMWSPPKGVDPLLSFSCLEPAVKAPAPSPAPAFHPIGGYMMIMSFEHLEVVRENGAREPFVAGEANAIMMYVNVLPSGVGVNPLKDARGTLYHEPRRTEDIGGFPTYGDVMVIATNGRPVWVPVSRERFLTAFVAAAGPRAAMAEASIVQEQKKLDAFLTPEAAAARKAKYQAAIDKVASKGAAAIEHERRYWERDEADSLNELKRNVSRDPKVSPRAIPIAVLKNGEDQLAPMSPADRAAQACVVDTSKDPTSTGLVPMGTSGCDPMVAINPDFFDTTLSRGAIQIVTLNRFRTLEPQWRKGRPKGVAGEAGKTDDWTTFEVFRTTDWHKVADMLGK